MQAVDDWLRGAGSNFTVADPDVERALESYRIKASAAIEDLGLRPVAMTSRSLDDVFQLALAKKAPFHPKTDAGFKDMVILLSVLDHLEHEPVASVLVTEDARFLETDIPELTTASNLPLRIVTVETVTSELEAALNQIRADAWQGDRSRAEDSIVSAWEDLSVFVAGNLDRIQDCFFLRPGRVHSARPTVLVEVSTPFPPERTASQKVMIDGKLEVEVEWALESSLPRLEAVFLSDPERVCVVTFKATATYSDGGYVSPSFLELEPTYEKATYTLWTRDLNLVRPTKWGALEALYHKFMPGGGEEHKLGDA